MDTSINSIDLLRMCFVKDLMETGFGDGNVYSFTPKFTSSKLISEEKIKILFLGDLIF